MQMISCTSTETA